MEDTQEKEEKKHPKHSRIIGTLTTFLFFFFVFQIIVIFSGMLNQTLDTNEYLNDCKDEAEMLTLALNESGLGEYNQKDLKVFGSENSIDGFLKLKENEKCTLSYYYGQTSLNNIEAKKTLINRSWEVTENKDLPLLLSAEKQIKEKTWILEKSKIENPNKTYSFKLYIKNSP
jgi:hypothetical protein